MMPTLFLQAVTATHPEVSMVILAAAAIGLIVNTLVVLGVALKGGRILGSMETSVKGLGEDVTSLGNGLDELRHTLVDQGNILARVVAQLDGVERRVEFLERRGR